MPEKSVRDMSERERRHRSLSARTFRSTLAGSVILGLVALAVGLGLYSIAMANQLVSEAFNLSRGAAVIFYLLGYFLYSTLYAAVGSIVSRTEELGQAVVPLTMKNACSAPKACAASSWAY